ncbi:hypothetical protein ACLBOM_32670 [Escherichia coli]
MGTGMAVDIALRTHEIPYIWLQAVEQQVAGLKKKCRRRKAGRVDLRDLPLVTIDGEDARDFDDAVDREKRGGGWAFMGRDCRRQLLCASANAAGSA